MKAELNQYEVSLQLHTKILERPSMISMRFFKQANTNISIKYR